ncbi:MAG: hypothetical protein H0U76_23345 [Ktedonobacteraceae bacterium]|nr:hypothetical protein [Ktedonobacteraceae bacterium]
MAGKVDNNISSEEYKEFLAERERITAAMNAAQSEFMFQTYKKLRSVLNRRYEAAIRLNITLENKQVSEVAKQKSAVFKAEKEKAKTA